MSIIELVKEYVLGQIKEYKEHSDDNYDFWNEHIKYVYEEALKLAKDYNADLEIVSLGALLHDIALINKVGERKDHHINSKMIAKEILENFNYDKNKTNRVLKCVYNHRSSKNAESIEEVCVADADILAHFDNIPMLFKSAFLRNNISTKDIRNWMRDCFEKDYNDLSEQTQETFKDEYKEICKKILDEEIYDIIEEIESPLKISLYISKTPYKKILTQENVINLTGQSGSGKSTYAKEHFNNDMYEIIDTDEILSEERFKSSTGINKNLGIYFREKYKTLPNLSDDFDLVYKEILEYCKNINKTIVIDCAQFHCIKDRSILKGQIIVLRTAIDTCYNRTISRWINNHKINNIKYTEEELNNYSQRKKSIYKWYKYTNIFIEDIDKM